jgi:protoporphyrin/coproporphyrin ferrochelatase
MSKKGLLLMNLGSPDSTEVADVRRYLREFLMDERVIDVPLVVRQLLVKGIIVPFRAPRSAKAYRSIWTPEGSPLIVLTRHLQALVEQKTDLPVAIAMRYGNPSPAAGFDELLRQSPDLEEVVLLPLYPHYAMSSYETAVEYARLAHQKAGYRFKLSVVPPFFDHPNYLDALAESIRPHLSMPYDHLLFSYHGIPERHVRKTDPTQSHCLTMGCCERPNPEAHAVCYTHQTKVTTMRIAAALGLDKNKYSQSFQSRLGRKWLTPYTDVRLKQMPSEGIKNLLVVCPAFVSDCLETLEEIAEEGRDIFLEHGGETFQMIPCLNTSPRWIDTVLRLVDETAQVPEVVHL